jgi:putative ABC transport system permease protein
MGWTRFFRRRYWDEERAREIDSYVEMETEENITRGMSPEDARHAANKKFGNTTQIREEIYSMNSIGFLETLWLDLRYGARLLRMNYGFTLVALLSLALGIGANTAIFQLLDAVRLRNLPVRDPQQLAEVRIANREWASGSFTGRRSMVTYPLWEQIRDQQQGFSSIFTWGDDTFNLAQGGQARYAQGLWVSGDFFNTLGVPAVLGRVFTNADDQRGCGSAGAVISYSFWQREFGADSAVIGRKLALNGRPFEIIGITPASFFGLEAGRRYDVAIPICAEPTMRGEYTKLDKRHHWWLGIIGRLKPGWTIAKATAQLNAISPAVLEATIPTVYNENSVKHYLEYRFAAFPAETGVSRLRTQYEAPLWLLIATAGLVLLIACGNLANLMLARAAARQREIAVRSALGASRTRLVRQLLSESLLLSLAGAAIGAWLAQVLSRFLVSFLSTQDNPVFFDLHVDWHMLAYTTALAILTCLVFGLVPAMRATQSAPANVMRATGRGLTEGSERFGLRRILVVSQVALSLVLVVGALLFVRSLRNLLTLDPGFQQDGILIAELDLTRLNVPLERRTPFKRELLERIRSIPGVESAARTSIVPISGSRWNEAVWMDGTKQDLQNRKISDFNAVSPGFFQTMGTPLLQGRDFDDRDSLNAPMVAIVNESFARKFVQSANPLGQRFRVEDDPGKPDLVYEIVGVVKNTKYAYMRDEFGPIAFLPTGQDGKPDLYTEIIIRSSLPLSTLLSAIKHTVAEVNPNIDLDFHVFKTQIQESLLRERLMATLSGFFGFLAGLLATIGLYGVISYTVARRTNEIGIRMALGAGRGAVLIMIMREAATLLGIGVVAGTILALLAARTARALLFGLHPNDPLTIAVAIAALGAVALAASFLPAQRAARVQPMEALRYE